MRSILVSGGMGFIGSNLIRHLLTTHDDVYIVNLDALTYAANPRNLADIAADRRLGVRYRFVHGDIRDAATVRAAMAGCWGVAHLAAETHVDRSLSAAQEFVSTQVQGTATLLEAARDAGVRRFLHVSTDEVYGDIPAGHASGEEDVLRPRSPYAASKAAAEQFCLAFHSSYAVPAVISRASNTIGPYQYPEKVVPLFATNALLNQPLPLYGDGSQVRDWLFVGDHCRALDLLLHAGAPGEVYNLGAQNGITNLELARRILALLGKPEALIRHVSDRPGHDRRYALDCAKITRLGWRPLQTLDSALELTVRWYRDNPGWWQAARNADFDAYYERQYAARLALAD